MGCEPELHRMHICSLGEQGEVELVHKLAVDATVECARCGAKAKDPANVCEPVQLPDIAWLGDGADTKV